MTTSKQSADTSVEVLDAESSVEQFQTLLAENPQGLTVHALAEKMELGEPTVSDLIKQIRRDIDADPLVVTRVEEPAPDQRASAKYMKGWWKRERGVARNDDASLYVYRVSDEYGDWFKEYQTLDYLKNAEYQFTQYHMAMKAAVLASDKATEEYLVTIARKALRQANTYRAWAGESPRKVDPEYVVRLQKKWDKRGRRRK